MTIALDVIKDTLIDSLKTLPFLFLAFLLLEALEHHAGGRINNALRSAGKAGPLLGSLLGCIPQCGFSVFAANLYSGGVITLGTLLAVFLATSDEALIILISEPSRGKDILLLLLFKIVIGITAGYIVDLFVKKHPEKEKHDILADELSISRIDFRGVRGSTATATSTREFLYRLSHIR